MAEEKINKKEEKKPRAPRRTTNKKVQDKTTKATNTTPTKSTQYSTTVSASNFDLQLTNILSICLIVVGVLLILLSIAILIRLKS